MKKNICLFIIILFSVIFVSCASHRFDSDSTFYQQGIASWYGKDFHGKLTSNGEIYDMHKLTAAHPTAPMGSYAIVQNISNGKKITVRINDRGPFSRKRIIDLSYGAAKELDMVDTGVAEVMVRIVPPKEMENTQPFSVTFSVQIGAFSKEENANSLKSELTRIFSNVAVVNKSTTKSDLFCVKIGPYKDRAQAEKAKNQLVGLGYNAIILDSTM